MWVYAIDARKQFVAQKIGKEILRARAKDRSLFGFFFGGIAEMGVRKFWLVLFVWNVVEEFIF